ncbi:MAG: NAD(P)H-dependent oxidoreductase [Candidatus Omnitrophota bacterium]
MNHLIVYGHPNPKSFNRAIVDTLKAALEEKEHEVRLRDLCALKFNPNLSQLEMENIEKNLIPVDVQTEHEHIKWANVITFVFPIWWGGPPAILKGYLDRVLSKNFAYTESEGGSKGLLTDKKVFTINTIDAPQEVYEKEELFKSMNLIWDKITLLFAGIQPLGHKYFSFVSGSSDEQRKAMLEEVKKLANELK